MVIRRAVAIIVLLSCAHAGEAVRFAVFNGAQEHMVVIHVDKQRLYWGRAVGSDDHVVAEIATRLAPGPHTLTVTRDGIEHVFTFDVSPHAITNVQIHLAPDVRITVALGDLVYI